MSYTPGPWSVNEEGFVMAGDTDIAVVSTAGEEALANAVLIAAAPEMLEALEAALSFVNTWHPDDGWDVRNNVAKKLNDIIYRVRGTPNG